MPRGLQARAAATCGVALLALACACSRTPDDKVVRWAAEVLPPPEPVAAADVSAPEPPSAPAPDDEGPAEVDELAMPPCERLLYRACLGLGPNGEECAQARRSFPPDRTPEWDQACQAVLDRHQDLIDADGEPVRGKGRNACRLLQQRLCEESGVNTWACREARDDANRLRRQRQTTSCLGDLLLREQAAIFSAKPRESEK
ncbi:MAG: hypothetical protein R3F39_00565 [Myxococcota bacterium]